jgi:ubiquinone/menaquinone biosynthesis C-methylase UbiE
MNKSNKKTDAPSASTEFDKMYNSFLHWFWTDIRIPKELKELISDTNPNNTLELGCGLGRFSAYLAKQGIDATGVDFSQVAIKKAIKRVANYEHKPSFLTGNVTHLDMLNTSFDMSFDIGCFHCLYEEDLQKYVSEVYRLLKPGTTHLIWALNHSPSGMRLNPEYIARIFGDKFQLVKSKFTRRRIIASYWYWLAKK